MILIIGTLATSVIFLFSCLLFLPFTLTVFLFITVGSFVAFQALQNPDAVSRLREQVQQAARELRLKLRDISAPAEITASIPARVQNDGSSEKGKTHLSDSFRTRGKENISQYVRPILKPRRFIHSVTRSEFQGQSPTLQMQQNSSNNNFWSPISKTSGDGNSFDPIIDLKNVDDFKHSFSRMPLSPILPPNKSNSPDLDLSSSMLRFNSGQDSILHPSMHYPTHQPDLVNSPGILPSTSWLREGALSSPRHRKGLPQVQTPVMVRIASPLPDRPASPLFRKLASEEKKERTCSTSSTDKVIMAIKQRQKRTVQDANSDVNLAFPSPEPQKNSKRRKLDSTSGRITPVDVELHLTDNPLIKGNQKNPFSVPSKRGILSMTPRNPIMSSFSSTRRSQGMLKRRKDTNSVEVEEEDGVSPIKKSVPPREPYQTSPTKSPGRKANTPHRVAKLSVESPSTFSPLRSGGKPLFFENAKEKDGKVAEETPSKTGLKKVSFTPKRTGQIQRVDTPGEYTKADQEEDRAQARQRVSYLKEMLMEETPPKTQAPETSQPATSAATTTPSLGLLGSTSGTSLFGKPLGTSNSTNSSATSTATTTSSAQTAVSSAAPTIGGGLKLNFGTGEKSSAQTSTTGGGGLFQGLNQAKPTLGNQTHLDAKSQASQPTTIPLSASTATTSATTSTASAGPQFKPIFGAPSATGSTATSSATSRAVPTTSQTSSVGSILGGTATLSSTPASTMSSSTTTGVHFKPIFGQPQTTQPSTTGGQAAQSFTPIFGTPSKPATEGTPGGMSFSAANTAAPTTVAPSLFGGASTASTTATARSTNVFGSAGQSTPAFGTSNPVSTTSGGLFGTNPNLGAAQPSTPSKPGGLLGSSTAQQTTTFGSIPSTPQKQPTFGGTPGTAGGTGGIFAGLNAPSTQKSIFGGSNTGNTQSSVFGNTTPASTQNSVFGGTRTTTTQSNVFGGASTAATQNSMFGGTSSMATQNSVFGGAGTTTPAFGTPAKTENSKPNFGTPVSANSNKPAFGNPTAMVTPFGSGTPQAPTQTASPFSFGASQNRAQTTAQPTQSGGFSFGSTKPPASFNFGSNASVTQSPDGFQFGQSTPSKPAGGANQQPSFSFGNNGASPAQFNAAPSFGSPAPNLGGSPAPNFGASPAPASGGFSIGAGPAKDNTSQRRANRLRQVRSRAGRR